MKLSAGSGYTYLTKQVARDDVTKTNGQALADYYSEKGERPGVWMGSGLDGLGESTGLSAGEVVTEAQMKNLFGQGIHPNAEAVMADAERATSNATELEKATRLGTPFRDPSENTSPLIVHTSRALNRWLKAHGMRRTDEIPDEVREKIRTDIAREQFAETFDRAPLDERELSAFITRETRQNPASVAGFDLTFSAPKSFTILWAAATPEQRAQLQQVHDDAVADALKWVEDNATFTRTGKDGLRQVKTRGLMATAFTHRDSRDGDPHLHTHVAISSKVQLAVDEPAARESTRDPDRWLALDGQAIYKSAVSASEHYNRVLEAKSRRLGLAFEVRDGSGQDGKQVVREVAGISPQLIEAMSSRRAEIREVMAQMTAEFTAKHGRPPSVKETFEISSRAHAQTRKDKAEPRSLDEQLATWTPRIDAALRAEGSDIPGDARGLFAAAQQASKAARDHALATPRPTTPEAVDDLARQIIARVSTKRAVFDLVHIRPEAERSVRRYGLSETAENTLVDDLVRAATSAQISTRIDAIDPVTEPDDMRRADGTSVYRRAFSEKFTTTAILDAETSLLEAARVDGGRVLDPAAVDVALLEQTANGVTLNDGQAHLVREMTTSGRMLQLALAPAGTGKTTAMSVLTKAWTESGGTVIGLAPSAAAAKVLGSSIDTSADTLDKLVWHIRGGAGTPPAWMNTIDANTMVIIDEAGMAGTGNLATAVEYLTSRGAQVRLIGDDQQLASPAAGGVLQNIATDVGALTLSEVVRFTTPGEAEASLAVRSGKTEALGFYLDAGRVHVGNETALADQVFTAWSDATARGREALMMAHSNDVVTDLNARARAARLALSGEPAGPSVALRSGLEASVGDTIVTRKNNRRLVMNATDFVKNGDRWTITEVRDDGSLRVQHHAHAHLVTLPTEYVATQVDLGYASTFHGAQGQTVDEGLALLSGGEDRQLFYVGTTRGRHANHVFVPDGGDGDEHNIIAPEVLIPPTVVETLEQVIARDGAVVSATTMLRDEHDPRTLIAASLPRYEDALAHAAARILGDNAMAELAAQAERILPGVSEAPAWDTLHAHLAYLALDDIDTLAALREAAAERTFEGARDVAAVLDWRLGPHAESRAATSGPLPWVPGIPERIRNDATYGAWVRERYELVQTDAARIRDSVHATGRQDAPEWSRAFLDAPDLHADVATWRAATFVPEESPDLLGKPRLSVRQRTYQDALLQRVERHAPAVTNPASAFVPIIEAREPRVLTDAWWPTLAARLDAAHTAGRDVAAILHDVMSDEHTPLPDEHAADALWFRVLPHLGAHAAAPENSHASARLRPTWTPSLENALGAELAGWVIADPAWPSVVATVTDTATATGLSAETVITSAVDRIEKAALPQPGTDHEPGRLGVHDLAQVLLWRIPETAAPTAPESELIGEGDLYDADVDAFLARTAAERDPRRTSQRDALPEQARIEAAADAEHEARRDDAQREEDTWAREFTTSEDRVIDLTMAAHAFYRAQYPESPAAAYVTRRLGEDLSATAYEPGYAPMSANKPWDARDLVTHLRETMDASDTELVDAGLAKWNKGGGDVYDLFRNRVMLPIHNAHREIIGFHARALDDSPAKYLNSPDTPAFSKGRMIYGVNEGYAAARAHGVSTQPGAVRVEGPIDAIAVTLASKGQMIGVTTGGTAFTDVHADRFAGLAREGKVYLALDNDRAGQSATQQAFWKFATRGVAMRSIPIPGAKDPGELYETNPDMLEMVLTTDTMHTPAVVDLAYQIARTYEAGTERATIENTIMAARQVGYAVAATPVEEWDQTITLAAPALMGADASDDDLEHMREVVWTETLATNIEWATPSSDGDQARPAQQVEVSQTKLDDLAVRLERAGANTRATRAAMAEITERIARARQDATRSRATHNIDPIAPDQRGPQR